MVLYHKCTSFQVGEKWLTRKKIRVSKITFLEPLFYTILEKWLQIKCSNGHGFSLLVLGKFSLVNGAIEQNKKVGKQSFNKETFSSLPKS